MFRVRKERRGKDAPKGEGRVMGEGNRATVSRGEFRVKGKRLRVKGLAPVGMPPRLTM